MPSIVINGLELKAKKGQTILQVAKKNGIDIENVCYTQSKGHKPICRVCSVKVEGVNGLLPSCSTVVEEGMVITSHDEEIDEIRSELIGFVMSEADSTGVIKVDIKSEKQEASRFEDGFVAERVHESVTSRCEQIGNDFMGFDPSKCIHCDKCILTCPNDVIGRSHRGSGAILSFSEGQTINKSKCTSCGDCVRVCPTGALYEKI